MQKRVLHVEVVARVLVRGKCVRATTVLLEIILIFVFLGILFGAEEEHVLQKVCGERRVHK